MDVTHSRQQGLPGFYLASTTVRDVERAQHKSDIYAAVIVAVGAKDSLNHRKMLRHLIFLAELARYVPLRYAILQRCGATWHCHSF